MLSISKLKSASAGSTYFNQDDNYYFGPGGERVKGASEWLGDGAKSLLGDGFSKHISEPDFDTLLRGCSPRTDEPLVRNAAAEDVYDEDGKFLKIGRGAYRDLSFSADKSVSILARADDRIEAAHDRAVRRVAAYIENKCAYSRQVDEKTGEITTIKTDKLAMARINHYENRENEPQLHSHLVVMNLTLCEDDKWRSVEFGKILENKKYLGQIYRNELAAELRKLGYGIEVTDFTEGLFKIEGVSDDMRDDFSTRRKQILDQEKKYRNEGKYNNASQTVIREFACLDTRAPKNNEEVDRKRREVEARLSKYDNDLRNLREQALRQAAAAAPSRQPVLSARECVRLAIRDVIDNESAFTEKDVIGRALKGGLGHYTVDELIEELYRQPDIKRLGIDGRYRDDFMTAEGMERIERSIIDYAQTGKGQSGAAIAPEKQAEHLARIETAVKAFSQGQRDTIEMITTARDRILLVQGDAGAGKTFAMEAAREILAAEGITVRGFAPTGKAAQELRSAGVESMTIDKYLVSAHEQDRIGSGEVWVVDEAGMIGSRKMWNFLQLAAEKAAKVVLVGDTKQFQAVDQGKIFQELQNLAGVAKTEITEVKRQKTEHAKEFVAAVKDDVEQAFEIAARHGMLKEIENRDDRLDHLIEEYLLDKRQGIDSVVLTGSNADRHEINRRIRERLAGAGAIKSRGSFEMFERCDLDSIAKKFARAYKPGQKIIFRQDCAALGDRSRGIQATIDVVDAESNTISIKYYSKTQNSYLTVAINLREYSATYDVFNGVKREFGIGDKVMFGKNDKKIGVSNGVIGTIEDICEDGTARIRVWDNKLVECNLNNRGDKAYTYIDHAYCLTNHKSQGSTYDKAIINADVSVQRANYNAFYVQATRARMDVSIITDNRNKLIKQAQVKQDKASTLNPAFANTQEAGQEESAKAWLKKFEERSEFQERLDAIRAEMKEESRKKAEEVRKMEEEARKKAEARQVKMTPPKPEKVPSVDDDSGPNF